MFLQWGNAVIFFVFRVFGSRFSRHVFYNFHEILMSCCCHFWVISGLVLCHFGAQTPKRSLDVIFVDFGFILGCFWEPFGHPHGGLLG